ncbi:MAG: glutathione S-transferase family protein [Pseudomonadota bacterium]
MIRVLGRATSSNVQAVMWGAAEMGISVQREDVGGAFGGNNTPGFLAMNPMGRVPILIDGDMTMFESQAILRYLGAVHGGEDIWPTHPATRAPVDQWAEWAKTSVAPVVIYKVFWQMVRENAKTRKWALIEEGIEELKVLMAIADRHLSVRDWFVHDRLTLADIAFGTQLYRYYTLDFDRAETPNLDAYYGRLKDRKAYQEHVMISYESLRVPE